MRRKLGTAAFAAAAVVASFATAPAQAAPMKKGTLCGFTASNDPSSEEGVQTGDLTGGPIVIADDTDPAIVQSGYMKCAIHVGAPNKYHTSVAAVATSGPSTPQVVAFPGTTVSYSAGRNEEVYVCTEVVVEGVRYYWDATGPNADPTATGAWSNYPATAECALAITVSTPGQDEPPFDTLGALVCPALAALFPPSGDIPGVWDCPPFGDNPPPPRPVTVPPATAVPTSEASGHITIHRFPGPAGSPVSVPRLWVAPVAQNGVPWTCKDVHTGLVVHQNDVLASPNPGVSCAPPSSYLLSCHRVDAGGYHAEAGTGTITITSACGSTLSTSQTMNVPFSAANGAASSAVGYGTVPWTCTISESATIIGPTTDYWTFCNVNTL